MLERVQEFKYAGEEDARVVLAFKLAPIVLQYVVTNVFELDRD